MLTSPHTALHAAAKLKQSGNLAGAKAELLGAQTAHPSLETHPDILNELALIAIDEKQWETCKSYIQKLLSAHPANGVAHNTLGVHYQVQGPHFYPQAKAAYLKALQLTGGLAAAHINLAHIYGQQGDVPGALGAINHTRFARKLQPGDAQLEANWQRMKADVLKQVPNFAALAYAHGKTGEGNALEPNFEGDGGAVYFLCPDFALPSAGMRRLYRYVHALNAGGVNACVVHHMQGYVWEHAPNAVPVCWKQHNFNPGPSDIVVLPEGFPQEIAYGSFGGAQKIVLALNWHYAWDGLKQAGIHQHTYKEMGVSHVLVASEIIEDYLAWSMDVPVTRIPNYVQTNIHKPEKIQSNPPKIAYTVRKDGAADILKNILTRKGAPFTNYTWSCCMGLSQTEYAQEVNTAQVFLITSPVEGVPTSVLEAMASGCIVVGYTGIGGAQCMVGSGTNQNCFLAETTNIPELGRVLENVLHTLHQNPEAYTHITENAQATAAQFANPAPEAEAICAFFTQQLQT